jgi:hypothetical protein
MANLTKFLSPDLPLTPMDFLTVAGSMTVTSLYPDNSLAANLIAVTQDVKEANAVTKDPI